MASVTFAVDKELKSKLDKFPWVNWSEVARENLLFKDKLEQMRTKLNTKEERELIKWSVDLGREAKKDSFKRLLAELPAKRREELLNSLTPEKREEFSK